MFCELLFGDILDDFGHRHGHPLRHLLLIGKEGIQQRNSIGEHVDLEVIFLFKIFHEFLKRDVTDVHMNGVPSGPLPLLALQHGLGLGRTLRFRACHEGDGQVEEAVFVGFDGKLFVGRANDLVHLQADEAGDEGGGGGNGRDDAPGNGTGLVGVLCGDLVVDSTQVGAGRHEEHMLIDVLVELDELEAKSSQRAGCGKLCEDLVALAVDVHIRRRGLLFFLILLGLYLHTLLGSKVRYDDLR
mmetsp:Transcript_26920/g.61971  ORF Transcript_26920/g.61971 Transcript_26920/m.61971 type:complete len:243 (-) Transcript_26920:948-1676(-)